MKTTMKRETPMENTGFSTGQIILAALGGALAGATVALLVAPKSGRETRHQLDGYMIAGREKVALIPEAFRNAGNAAMETMTQEPVKGKHS